MSSQIPSDESVSDKSVSDESIFDESEFTSPKDYEHNTIDVYVKEVNDAIKTKNVHIVELRRRLESKNQDQQLRLSDKKIVMSTLQRGSSSDDYYDKGIGLDFSIKIKEQIIKASKFVLGFFSPVFEVMLEKDWRDSRENLTQVDDVEYDVMVLFVKALHGVSVYPDDIDTAFKLIIVSDKYDVEEIKQQASSHVQSEICGDNVINILSWAHKLNIEDIKQAALNFMMSLKYQQIEELNGYEEMSIDVTLLLLKMAWPKFG